MKSLLPSLPGLRAAKPPGTNKSTSNAFKKGALLGLAAILSATHAFAQPSVSYTSPQTYTAGTAITPLTPLSSNVAAQAYNTSTINLGSFNQPTGIAVDASGNVFIAVEGDNTVEELPAGGGPAFVVGTGFNHPKGVAVDAAGNVYVADVLNNAIKKIVKADGSIITLISGYPNEFGITVDQFNNVYFNTTTAANVTSVYKIPAAGGSPVMLATGLSAGLGLTVDGSGNLFMAEFDKQDIVEIPAGSSTPFVFASGLVHPYGIDVDAAGNVYFGSVHEGSPSELWEVPFGGTATYLGIAGGAPTSIAVDPAGNLYAANDFNLEVDKYLPLGGFYTGPFLPAGLIINTTTGVISGTPTISSPAKDYTVTAYDNSGNSASSTVNITVLGPPNIAYATPQTYTIGTAISPLTPISNGVDPQTYNTSASMIGSGYNHPVGVAVDAAGTVYVADQLNNSVEKVPAGGSPIVIGTGFNRPDGIAVDAAGNVYVADAGNSAIKKIMASNGSTLTLATNVSNPFGIAVDGSQNLYFNSNVSNVTTVFKMPVAGGTPVSIAAGLENGLGLAVDAAGNVFMVEFDNLDIVEIPATGGSPFVLASGLQNPYGLGIDAADNLYFTAVNGNQLGDLWEIPQGGSPVDLNFPLNQATSVVIDPAGNLYIGDLQQSHVYKFTPLGGFYTGPFLPAGLLLNTTTGVITGTPTKGAPAKNYTITAYNSYGSASANVNLYVPASNDDALTTLLLSRGTLSPGFDSTITRYTAGVGAGVPSVDITPTIHNAFATITINGTAATSGSATTVPLVTGANNVVIVVTAQDGSTQRTYNVKINESQSANDNLATLKTDAGLAQGATVPLTLSETVVNAVTELGVTPVAVDAGASITVNDNPVGYGRNPATVYIPLNQGSNIITIVVTAANGATKTYTLTVTRSPVANSKLSSLTVSNGTLSPAFGTATNYNDYVGNGAQFTITPTTADPGATMTINGVTATSGTATGVPLVIGNNTVTIVVTAQNNTTKTYTVLVNQARSLNNNLFSLRTSGGLAQGKTVPATLNETVGKGVATITVTPTLDDTTARVTVNNAAVKTGTPSASIALLSGENTITIVVTAQNQTTKTYTLNVQRGPELPFANSLNDVVSVEKPMEQIQLATDDITVHPGVSPNGDGVNDVLQIDNISKYPENKLSIMNRNGQLVFEAKGYDNATKTFDGHSNKTGQMQLPGTYFYSLDYTVDGVVKHKTGFLVLKY